ncbi:NAD-dependent epimerase/dehydratase family protein [Parvibaculum sp.]|uniref:NAD-dependent epimerase/dehydratase family protein n=1 Tax=Parvibaculum sp. TaxID=2024848 RepID=UPI002626B69E|nr:NAD-dependent epimerase/dehydratase family protein [Parvibaculum sp.]MCW5726857.1 NAD-dependent epimerase/dehydratase family protein [Parvibaculum sp.]
MKNVLITGGAGFIGVNLTAHLAAHGGYAITVLDNESMGDRRHLEPFGVRFIHGDICDDAALAAALDGQEVVVHLAADTRVMDSIDNPVFNFEVNAVGSLKVLEACRKRNTPRMIAASTGGAIIGEAEPPVHEDMVARPLAPYGASKLAMEGYMSAYTGAYGIGCCALRFSNIYGPRSFHKGSVVAHFFKQILAGKELIVYGDGSQARDFLYIEDLVDGVRRAMESDATGVYQLGSGYPTTVNELLDVMSSVVGRTDLPIKFEGFRAGEIHRTWCEISRAREAFGFDPATSLSDGLERTWAWFNAR